MKHYLEEKEAVLSALGSGENGISEKEAGERLAKYGENKLAEKPGESLLHRFMRQLMEPMTVVLIIAAVISIITGIISHEGISDAIIIITVVILNAILGVYQESKAESAIAALQQIAAATAKVCRAGHISVIPATNLVPGDVILLEAGDSVPADARLIEAASLKVEEAALTGESVPAEKTADVLQAEGKDVPLGDRANMVYMGSIVEYGRGKAVITGTGMETEMGKIAGQLSEAEHEETPLQLRLRELSRILTVMILVICGLIFGINIIRALVTGDAVTGSLVLDTFMIAISLAVAAIPEGLSAVVTIVLSIGVTKMSKNHAIIRRLTAVETLGCAGIICSDKTGTLTQNKMTVVDRFTPDAKLLMTGMALCSDAEWENEEAVGEATECALVADAGKNGLPKPDLSAKYPRIGEAPFDSLRKMMTTVHTAPEGDVVRFTKGAVDMVLGRCTTYLADNGEILPITDEKRKEIAAVNKGFADQALRVLALGMARAKAEPASYEADALEQELTFIGLSAMKDPIRPEVKAAIEECRSAGIRPVMITGDHKDTAIAIAKELGILGEGQMAITGAELSELSDEYFAEHVVDYSVYARVQPEHKVRIVNAWKARGEVTAMTGDGVNDAPSIKSADIGVGMGITGTDVTKHVADMILTDDNFATIVTAVAEGRRIYDNLRKAIQFLLSSNLAEVFAIFIATLMNFTILKPAHLLWINLITDCFPAIGLGTEAADKDSMNRPPRKKSEGIFAGGLGFDVVFQGFLIALLTIGAYFMGHHSEMGNWKIQTSATGMTMAFLTLSAAEIFHSFNMRSRDRSLLSLKKQNGILWITLLGSFLLTAGVLFIPFFRKAFHFTAISGRNFFISIGIAFLIIPIVEVTKLIRRMKNRS